MLDTAVEMQKLAKLLEEGILDNPDAIIQGPVLVYGAGNKGKQIASFLVSLGYPILGFADAAAEDAGSWNGMPIRTFSNWQARTNISQTSIVVAIHNHKVDMTQLLQILAQSGAKRIINPVEFQTIFAKQFPDSYWLTAPSNYIAHIEKLMSLASLFSDHISLDVLKRVIEFRLSGNYAVLPRPTIADQYCPANLRRWRNPMRLIDCGAFDGDSLRQFKKHGYAFEQIMAFEPDPENYRRLSRQVLELGGGICIPCGVAAKSETARFDSNGSGASSLSEGGEHVIQCLSIDEALSGISPTLIKMDIEGAEPGALSGALNIISKHKPDLAISIYHHPEHLWEIPMMINAWGLNYQFHLGMHGHSSFDLVLYAMADSLQ